MKEQFVTYEIALKLKELGFDEECLTAFSDDKYHDLLHLCENHTEGNFTIELFQYGIKAPLWQQVIDWFRNRYNLLIDSPKLDVWNIGKWSVKMTSIDKSIVLEEHVGQPYWRIYRCFRTYEEAREQAILKAIELRM